MNIYKPLIKTGFTLGSSFGLYEIAHGAATEATKLLERGEVAGGLAILVTLVAGYLWMRKDLKEGEKK